MASLMQELLNILDEENKIYDSIYNMADLKKESIIKNDTDKINSITQEENTTVGKLQRLEKQRIAVVKDICNVLNIRRINVTMTDIADNLNNPEDKKNLLDVSLRLRETINKVKESNEQNKLLIDNALDYVNFSMNLIRSSSNLKMSYDVNGEEIGDSESIFDTKL